MTNVRLSDLQKILNNLSDGKGLVWLEKRKKRRYARGSS
jgi:hypothetical protein